VVILGATARPGRWGSQRRRRPHSAPAGASAVAVGGEMRVAVADLIRDRLRARLWPEPGLGDLNGDFRVGGWIEQECHLRPAAVLVPLVEHPGGTTVLLTRRTDHLYHHPGQVSFPGGQMEAQDQHPVQTAMRETREEIGLDPGHVEVIGYLDPYQTVTGFRVTPVVAMVEPGFSLSVDSFEVAEVFEVPLRFVLDPANHRRDSRILNGRQREFYVLSYQQHHIWGATAAMLVNLYEKLC